MSEPTILEAVKTRMAEVGGSAWIDELLIRGDANGIRGGHLVIGWSAPDALGDPETGTRGPVPLTLATDDPLWEQLKTDLNATATQQAIDKTAECEALQAQVAELTDQRDAAVSQAASLQEQLDSIEWVE